MEAEYDLSKGIRGKFYRKNAKLHIPVYLDEASRKIVERAAKKEKKDISAIVNELIQRDGELVEAAK